MSISGKVEIWRSLPLVFNDGVPLAVFDTNLGGAVLATNHVDILSVNKCEGSIDASLDRRTFLLKIVALLGDIYHLRPGGRAGLAQSVEVQIFADLNREIVT